MGDKSNKETVVSKVLERKSPVPALMRFLEVIDGPLGTMTYIGQSTGGGLDADYEDCG